MACPKIIGNNNKQKINKLIITNFWFFFDYCGMHYCAVCSKTRSLIEKWRLPFKSLSFRVYFIIISSVGPTITGKFLGHNGPKYLLKSKLWSTLIRKWYTPIQENFIYKKQGPSPISLVRATRIFSKAKTLKKNLICHWPSEIIPFIRFEMHMDRPDKS